MFSLFAPFYTGASPNSQLTSPLFRITMAIRSRYRPEAATLRDTFNSSRRAIAWSLLMAMAVVQVGYVQSLSFSMLMFPAFVARYSSVRLVTFAGEMILAADISPKWAIGLQLCIVSSSMLGALLAG